MRDNISIQRVDLLHPKAKENFRKFIEDAESILNIKLRVTQGLRTFPEQQALYNQGRTSPGKKVTNAKPGQSYHNYGLAIDVVRMDGDKPDWSYDLSKLVPMANKYGIFWGGNFKKFKDFPHFEMTFGNGWRELLAKYNNKDFIAGTNYVKI